MYCGICVVLPEPVSPMQIRIGFVSSLSRMLRLSAATGRSAVELRSLIVVNASSDATSGELFRRGGIRHLSRSMPSPCGPMTSGILKGSWTRSLPPIVTVPESIGGIRVSIILLHDCD